MSKGNMLLGHARGKVGSLVFSRSNGKQVVRANAEVVKNPQTEKQMIQRIIMATVAQAYSRFQPICDHSWEGLQSGQKTMSAFISANLKLMRENIAAAVADNQSFDDIKAFTPVGSNEYASNAYIIAKGKLPEIVTSFSGSTRAKMDGIAENTYAGVLAAYGLQRGDQLTFVTTQGASGANMIFHFARVILDPMNADGSEADLSSSFIADGAINKPNTRNEGSFNALEFAAGSISWNFSAQAVTGAAVIVSRQKADGTYARSNATLQVNDAGIIYERSLQECLDLVASGSIDTLSTMYLNNSGTGRVAGEVYEEHQENVQVSNVKVNGTSVNVPFAQDEKNGNVTIALTASGVETAGRFKFGYKDDESANYTLGTAIVNGANSYQTTIGSPSTTRKFAIIDTKDGNKEYLVLGTYSFSF